MKTNKLNKDLIIEEIRSELYIDEIDNDRLYGCCGILELSGFVTNNDISDIIKNILPCVKGSNKTLVLTEILSCIKDDIIECSTHSIKTNKIIKYPFIVTLLTKDQSQVIKLFKELAKDKKEFPGTFVFKNTVSGSTGNALTVILYLIDKR